MSALILLPAPGHPLNPDGAKAEARAVKLQVAERTPVLDAALAARFAISTLCGGAMACQTCRVEVVEGAEHLSPCGTKERKLLDELRAGPRARFACQARVLGTGDVTIEVPPPSGDDEEGELP